MDDGDQFRSPFGARSTNLPSDAVAQVPFSEFKKYMASEISGIKITICEEISSSLNQVKDRAEKNSENITEMREDMKAIREATAPDSFRKNVISIIREEKAKTYHEQRTRRQ